MVYVQKLDRPMYLSSGFNIWLHLILSNIFSIFHWVKDKTDLRDRKADNKNLQSIQKSQNSMKILMWARLQICTKTWWSIITTTANSLKMCIRDRLLPPATAWQQRLHGATLLYQSLKIILWTLNNIYFQVLQCIFIIM